jgi:hypothetical protein
MEDDLLPLPDPIVVALLLLDPIAREGVRCRWVIPSRVLGAGLRKRSGRGGGHDVRGGGVGRDPFAGARGGEVCGRKIRFLHTVSSSMLAMCTPTLSLVVVFNQKVNTVSLNKASFG